MAQFVTIKQHNITINANIIDTIFLTATHAEDDTVVIRTKDKDYKIVASHNQHAKGIMNGFLKEIGTVKI